MAKRATNPVQRAVDKAGGVRKVALACGVSTQAVYKWIESGRVVNINFAFLLADAAGTDVRELAGNANT